jgi:hypothetical protein
MRLVEAQRLLSVLSWTTFFWVHTAKPRLLVTLSHAMLINGKGLWSGLNTFLGEIPLNPNAHTCSWWGVQTKACGKLLKLTNASEKQRSRMVQWLTPVIQATEEVEIWRIEV